MSMPERLLYRAIKVGLDWYKADEGQRYEQFCLNNLELTADESANARIYFAGGTLDDAASTVVKARPPTLHHGYPRPGGPFPAWSITLGGDRESQVYLADDAYPLDEDGERFIDEDGNVVDPKQRRIEYTFSILCIADHPDVTMYYYGLLRNIVLSQRSVFIDGGVDTPVLRGADLAPDARYLPSDVFARQLAVTVQGDECWTEPIDGGFAGSVAGIAMDDTGDGKTSGDDGSSVKALVTSYTAGS